MEGIAKIPSEEEFAWYLYGIIPWPENHPDLDLGLTGAAANLEISIIPKGSLGAVVSKVPLSQFGEAVLEENLQDLSWLEERVRLHQEMLRKIMQVSTVIPMKFGIIFRSVERVEEILEERREHFQQLLELLKGCWEWGVKGYYCREQLHKYLSSREGAPGGGQGGAGMGKAYLLSKKLQEDLESRGADYSRKIGEAAYARLNAHSAAANLNRFLSRKITGRQEELFLNASFLVAGASLEVFRDTVAKFNLEFASQGIFLEVTGPWPPYNFVGE